MANFSQIYWGWGSLDYKYGRKAPVPISGNAPIRLEEQETKQETRVLARFILVELTSGWAGHYRTSQRAAKERIRRGVSVIVLTL